ncbi:MAG: glycine cleavage system protein H [Dehalococcoidia bacterium]|nr:glycine cleavage system protein H [Dehalococcoidia bacterium]
MYPEDCQYTKEHEWVRLEDNIAVVGITDYAQDHLGDVVFIELPAVGADMTQFEPFGVIDSVKASSDLYAPLSGQVTAVNDSLTEQPELVNQEPYGGGWIVKVNPSASSELDELLSASEYEQFLSTLDE